MAEIIGRIPATRPASLAQGLMLKVLVGMETWSERRRQRRALAELPSFLLHDIGLAPGDVWREARKPFWRE